MKRRRPSGVAFRPAVLPDPHSYYANGIPTRRGGPEGCAHCPLPKTHAVHDVKPTDADVKAAEARKIGESPTL